MSVIRNEVKNNDKEIEKKKFVVRNAADIQRAKLEKLMKNPVIIYNFYKSKNPIDIDPLLLRINQLLFRQALETKTSQTVSHRSYEM